jgi:hypothetical protein
VAGRAQLRRILPQACHDSVFIRYLFAAKPKNIGRAGKLLLKRSAMLGKRRTLNQHDAANRQRKAQDNPVRSHALSFLDSTRAYLGATA